MARYFLDLDECGSVTRDDEGIDCPDLSAARDLAVRAAREVMCAEVATGELCLGCRIDVRDEHGLVVMQVPFSDALHVRDVPPC